jgi:uncharacterized protein (DUF2267 family)
VRAVERAARAELRSLPAELQGSTLAKAVLNLARRLDGEPADREAVLLARELRMALGQLHRAAPEGGVADVERFLARVAAPDLGHTAN